MLRWALSETAIDTGVLLVACWHEKSFFCAASGSNCKAQDQAVTGDSAVTAHVVLRDSRYLKDKFVGKASDHVALLTAWGPKVPY